MLWSTIYKLRNFTVYSHSADYRWIYWIKLDTAPVLMVLHFWPVHPNTLPHSWKSPLSQEHCQCKWTHEVSWRFGFNLDISSLFPTGFSPSPRFTLSLAAQGLSQWKWDSCTTSLLAPSKNLSISTSSAISRDWIHLSPSKALLTNYTLTDVTPGQVMRPANVLCNKLSSIQLPDFYLDPMVNIIPEIINLGISHLSGKSASIW